MVPIDKDVHFLELNTVVPLTEICQCLNFTKGDSYAHDSSCVDIDCRSVLV